MSLPPDPLGAIERALIAELVSSLIRHDLRNKLSSIRNANFYITRRVQKTDLWTSDPRTQQFLQLVEQLVADSDVMLDKRVSTSHLRIRCVEQVSARACVELAIASARAAASAPIDFTWAGDDAALLADSSEVAVALRSLIENAAESMPGGGAVRVRGVIEPVPAEGLATGASRLLRVSVEDEGPGLPESVPWAQAASDHANHASHASGVSDASAVSDADVVGAVGEPPGEALFEPLRTTKPGHAGLGLSIARRIAQSYKGRLAFRPQSAGARIELELPTVELGRDRVRG